MDNLPNPPHPPWCLRGASCAHRADLHLSRPVDASVTGREVIQVGVGLWRMQVGPTPPSGLLFELSAGADVERWPVDLAQSRVLARLLPSLPCQPAGHRVPDVGPATAAWSGTSTRWPWSASPCPRPCRPSST